MPGFKRPAFPYAIDVNRERKALRAHKPTRALPQRQAGHLLLATWNIANLGAPEQEREPECFPLLAEIVSYFDLVAVQEIRDDVSAPGSCSTRCPARGACCSPRRAATTSASASIGTTTPSTQASSSARSPSSPRSWQGLVARASSASAARRTSGTFHSGSLQIELVSAHSFFGKAKNPLDMARRLAETKALGWWCQERSKDPDSYTKDILAVGDLNTPSEDDWPMAKQMLDDLRARGSTPHAGTRTATTRCSRPRSAPPYAARTTTTTCSSSPPPPKPTSSK
jgi:hypothetical protein